MSDPATLSRAARLIALITPRETADAVLRRELTPRRDLDPARRREIARAVSVYFRWLGWLDPAEPPQRRVAAALALQARFDGDPAAIKEAALAARAVPGWTWDEIDLPAAARGGWLRQLQRDPPRWIRVRREFASSLPRALGDCTPVQSSGLRVQGPGQPTPNPERRNLNLTAHRYTGPRDLFLTDEFRAGRFEIQDLASQLVGCACAPQPGETWWDACAGEGGKTLHLADLMGNRGLIWASDRSVRRLQKLRERAARARVFNYRAAVWTGGPHPPTRTRFDGILVDAPCSGLGTWQRHPHARWTVSPDDVRELAAVQRQLLDHVAGALKPGGRLVYAVCTLTRTETTGVAAAFSAAHPDIEPTPVFPFSTPSTNQASLSAERCTLSSVNPASRPSATPPSLSSLSSVASAKEDDACPLSSVDPASPASATPDSLSFETLWPQYLNANGMFIAAWRRP